MDRLISFGGLFVMIGLAWLMSSNRRKISLRVVIGGMLLQFIFAWLVLKTAAGQEFFAVAGLGFKKLLGFVSAGAEFMFGINPGNDKTLLKTFAFGVLPTIIFFSALMAILYYIGIMQWVVRFFGWIMRRTLGTTGPESLAAAGNIFLGQTEAPLIVRPYLNTMTRSELMAVMVPGFGSTAGGVMAAYVGMGIDAGHLITASVLSAPAGLLIAKVLQPEEEPVHDVERVELEYDPRISGCNLVEAASIGVTDGLKLALNVGAMLIAFLALIAMLNAGVGWIGETAFNQKWSLQAGLSYLFAPLAWMMGIPWEDCLPAGELLGLRMAANEFIAYDVLAQWIKPDSGVVLNSRTQIILTYALSGFANFASIGIQIGGIGALAPDRQSELAKLGLRAMLGGTLACFMTACMAGLLI